LVDRRGLEPRLLTCKASVIPPILAAQICPHNLYRRLCGMRPCSWWTGGGSNSNLSIASASCTPVSLPAHYILRSATGKHMLAIAKCQRSLANRFLRDHLSLRPRWIVSNKGGLVSFVLNLRYILLCRAPLLTTQPYRLSQNLVEPQGIEPLVSHPA
jgi:hypothetical protein